MLTIIVLAFSLIGIVGLSIENRFVLIIFAACMTLILIASITIYAIGRTEEDSMKPKVPYYTTASVNVNSDPSDQLARSVGRQTPRVNQLGKKQETSIKSKQKGSKANSKLGSSTATGNRQLGLANLTSRVAMLINAEPLEESSDDLTTVALPISRTLESVVALSQAPGVKSDKRLANLRAAESQRRELEDQIMEQQDSPDRVQNDQWVAYERYIYERYLNILSQSIDLIMHTILASWLALLIDEDSDQCFSVSGNNNKPAESHRSAKHSSSHSSSRKSAKNSETIYNYNGVRYSIRPDTANESPTRVVVR